MSTEELRSKPRLEKTRLQFHIRPIMETNETDLYDEKAKQTGVTLNNWRDLYYNHLDNG
jgi:hypothetical protein